MRNDLKVHYSINADLAFDKRVLKNMKKAGVGTVNLHAYFTVTGKAALKNLWKRARPLRKPGLTSPQ